MLSDEDLKAIEERARATESMVAHAGLVSLREDVPKLLDEVKRLRVALRKALEKIQTAGTTLALAASAADESVRTIKDDADAAATSSCTLREGVRAALEQLGVSFTPIPVRRAPPRCPPGCDWPSCACKPGPDGVTVVCDLGKAAQ